VLEENLLLIPTDLETKMCIYDQTQIDNKICDGCICCI